MIVHSYYYGPIDNSGYSLQTTQGLTQIIDEDIIRELYTRGGNYNKAVQFSNLYKTLKGPVLAVTRIEPTKSSDNRATLINRTFFVRLEDVVNDLFKLMDSPSTFPLTAKTVKFIES